MRNRLARLLSNLRLLSRLKSNRSKAAREQESNARRGGDRPDAVESSRVPSLRWLFLVPLLVQMVAVAGIITWLSIQNGQRAVEEIAFHLHREIGMRVEQHLHDYLDIPHQINRITADSLQSGAVSYENLSELEGFLEQQQRWFDSANLIAVGLEATGSYVEVTRSPPRTGYLDCSQRTLDAPTVASVRDRPHSDKLALAMPDEDFGEIANCQTYDPRDRPWYRAAIEMGESAWSQVYSTQFDRRLVLAASRPIYSQNGRMVGVATSNTELADVSRFLNQLSLGQSGEVFIAEADGQAIATSSAEFPYILDSDRQPQRLEVTESLSPLIRSTARHLIKTYGSLGQVPTRKIIEVDFDGTRQWVQVLPFRDPRGLDWAIVIVIPEADFTGPLRMHARQSLLVGAIAAAISAAVAVAISRWAIDPILAIVRAANELSLGRWQQQLAEPNSRELRLLADAFNRMAAQLEHSFATLQSAESKYREIFENAVSGMYQSTAEGNFLNANPALARLFGYESPSTLIEAVSDISRQLYVSPRRRREFIAALVASGEVREFESQMYRADGSTIWVSEHARGICDRAGRILYFEGTIEDITQRKQTEARLTYLATRDPLTGLPNRQAFLQQLHQAIGVPQSMPFAVLFLDLDDFKRVNDSLGHIAGDRLLVAFVQRISSCLRPRDILARFGGDEFTILLPSVMHQWDATRIARCLFASLEQPFAIDGEEVFVGTSVGIVLSSDMREREAEAFLRDADIALYQAKARGKGCYVVFDRNMHAVAVERLQLENDLRRAIEREEFVVYYQPVIALDDERLEGFEALVRWQHPEKGLISPGKFIPVAEETGAIVPLGEWVMRAACQQMRAWQMAGLVELDATISVNVAGKQFSQANLVSTIQRILQQTKLAPRCLCVEVTESLIFENADEIAATLQQLRSLEIEVAIDDFGTGYSSLSRLQEFPVDRLKLDRSFIKHVDSDRKRGNFVRTIIDLARTLEARAIAEGIETQAQKDGLLAFGCESGQGFLFAPPLDVTAIGEFLSTARAPFRART